MKILILASILSLFICETTGHIRYWTEDEVDWIQRELEKFQKKDEDRDAALVSSLTGSVYVLQNKMAELAQDLKKGSEAHLGAAIGGLSINLDNLKSLLEEAKTLSSEYAAHLEKQAELEMQATQLEMQGEQEGDSTLEKNRFNFHSKGELERGFFCHSTKMDDMTKHFHFINRFRIW